MLDVFGDDMLDYEYRRDCYERHRVIEYVAVRLTEPVEWIWNRLIDGKFSVIETADYELIMSAALPGLWIPSHALKHRDWWAIMGAIARGVSRVGHHDFMDTIWNAGKSRAGEVERIEADRLNTLDDSESSGQSTTCTLPSGIVSWYKAEGNADDAVGNYNMPDGNDLFIGNYFWPGNWGFTGSIDELSIYNRALSALEIQTLYHAGSGGKSNGSAPAASRGVGNP